MPTLVSQLTSAISNRGRGLKLQTSVETTGDEYIGVGIVQDIPQFDIPQFEKKAILSSKLKSKKTGRSLGGIIILYKSHLKSKIEFTKICPNYLLFKLKNFNSSNILTGNTKYLHVCAVYIPPESSPYFKDDIFDDISNDINNFENLQTPIMLCGDFNSRTGKLLDYVPDKGDEHLKNNLKVTTQIVSDRKTSDSEINNHGKKLINLCKENNLRIMVDVWGTLLANVLSLDKEPKA